MTTSERARGEGHNSTPNGRIWLVSAHGLDQRYWTLPWLIINPWPKKWEFLIWNLKLKSDCKKRQRQLQRRRMPGRPSKFQRLGPWFCSSSLDFGISLGVLPGLGANKPFFFSFKALGVCFCHLSSKLSWLIYCRDCEPIPMKLERTAHFWDSLCEQSPDHIRKLLFGPARGLGFLVI